MIQLNLAQEPVIKLYTSDTPDIVQLERNIPSFSSRRVFCSHLSRKKIIKNSKINIFEGPKNPPETTMNNTCSYHENCLQHKKKPRCSKVSRQNLSRQMKIQPLKRFQIHTLKKKQGYPVTEQVAQNVSANGLKKHKQSFHSKLVSSFCVV